MPYPQRERQHRQIRAQARFFELGLDLGLGLPESVYWVEPFQGKEVFEGTSATITGRTLT